MKNTKTMLGRALAPRSQETKRQAALIARRQERSLWRFVESLNGGIEFTDNRILRYPVG